jgi:carboxylesterase
MTAQGPTSGAGGPAPTAVLLHDFGGSPNTLRAWGQALADEGIEVSIPRLPGHGTRWKDLNRTTFDDWLAAAREAVEAASVDRPAVHVLGLGLGATLALALAAEGAPVAGVVAVNPALTGLRQVRPWDNAWRWLRRSKPAVVDDIRKHGVTNTAYRRTALKAASSLADGGRRTAEVLPRIAVPVRVVTSAEDNVVRVEDGRRVHDAVPGATSVVAQQSLHVVPLDNDQPLLVEEALAAIRGEAPVHADARPDAS